MHNNQSPIDQLPDDAPRGWNFGNIVSGVVGTVGSTITLGRNAFVAVGGVLYQSTHYLTQEAKEELLQPLALKIRAIQTLNADTLTNDHRAKCEAMLEFLNLILEDDSKKNWGLETTKQRVKDLQNKIDGMRWLLHPEIHDDVTRQIAEAVVDCLQKIDPSRHLADKVYSLIADNCNDSYCHWKSLTLQSQSLLARYNTWEIWRKAQEKSTELSSHCEQLIKNAEALDASDELDVEAWKKQIELILTEMQPLPYIILQPEKPDNLHKGWNHSGGQSVILQKLLKLENIINEKYKTAKTKPLSETFNFIKNKLNDGSTKNLSEVIAGTETLKKNFANEFDTYEKGDPIQFKTGGVVASGVNVSLVVLKNALGYILTTDETKRDILRTANLALDAHLNLEEARNPTSALNPLTSIIKAWAYLQESIEKHEQVVSESLGSKPPRRAAYLLHATNLNLLETVNGLNVKQDTGLHLLIREHVSFDDGLRDLLIKSAEKPAESASQKIAVNNK